MRVEVAAVGDARTPRGMCVLAIGPGVATPQRAPRSLRNFPSAVGDVPRAAETVREERGHALDNLRAVARLLGSVLHAGISSMQFKSPWPVGGILVRRYFRWLYKPDQCSRSAAFHAARRVQTGSGELCSSL